MTPNIIQAIMLYAAGGLIFSLYIIHILKTPHAHHCSSNLQPVSNFSAESWMKVILSALFYPLILGFLLFSYIGDELVKERKLIDIKGMITGERSGK